METFFGPFPPPFSLEFQSLVSRNDGNGERLFLLNFTCCSLSLLLSLFFYSHCGGSQSSFSSFLRSGASGPLTFWEVEEEVGMGRLFIAPPGSLFFHFGPCTLTYSVWRFRPMFDLLLLNWSDPNDLCRIPSRKDLEDNAATADEVGWRGEKLCVWKGGSQPNWG